MLNAASSWLWIALAPDDDAIQVMYDRRSIEQLMRRQWPGRTIDVSDVINAGLQSAKVYALKLSQIAGMLSSVNPRNSVAAGS
jgi:hypothetical protein